MVAALLKKACDKKVPTGCLNYAEITDSIKNHREPARTYYPASAGALP